MTTGEELNDFIVALNGEATIDNDLLNVLVQTAQAVIEGERDWMVLRKVDTSIDVTTGSEWDSGHSIAGITDFLKFYGNYPIRIFDGDNRVVYLKQVPLDRRLTYKDAVDTFCYDPATQNIYINGEVAFSGTLYISYIKKPTLVDISSASDVWTEFPERFLPVLGYYAVGIHKGGVDYDSINARMVNFAEKDALTPLKMVMEKWDNDMQQSSIEFNDPVDSYGGGHRDGAINRGYY